MRRLSSMNGVTLWLYRTFTHKSVKNLVVNLKTDITIEGFPRSGNTFAVVAFLLSQDKHIRIAHHLHIPAQITYSVKNNIPCMVVIRSPIDTITSLSKISDESFTTLVKYYISYHKIILEHQQDLLIVDFSTITKDYGAVIDQLNKKFNTRYKKFSHTDQNVNFVFRVIDLINNIVSDGLPSHVARPVEGRNNNQILMNTSDRALLNKANLIYGKLKLKADLDCNQTQRLTHEIT